MKSFPVVLLGGLACAVTSVAIGQGALAQRSETTLVRTEQIAPSLDYWQSPSAKQLKAMSHADN